MKRIFKWFALLFAGALVLAAALAAHTWYFKPVSLNWFYTRVFLQFALDSPELLTQLRLLEPMGIRSHNAKLGDASIAHGDEKLAKLKDDYATFKTYDASGLAGQDRLSYDIFDYFVSMQVRGEPWRYNNYPVNQLFGVQSNLPNLMTQQQQVNDAVDAENYIARLGEFPRMLNQVIDGIKLRERKGVIPPKFVVEKVLSQIQGFMAPGAGGNTLTVNLKEKLEQIPASKMDEATKNALLARAERAVGESVFPAYKALATYFETLRPKATHNDGVWALPDGDKYYQYQIELSTTTKMTAQQLHQIGLEEVARISNEMDGILKAIGYNEGTVGERVRRLAKSPEQLYSDSDAGRAQILKDYQAIIDQVSAGLDPWFGIKPVSKVEVKRVPPFTEKTAPGAYYNPPPMDGSRPGVFFVNLGDVAATPKYFMHTLAYHEAVPGHHLQIAIAREVKGLPIFRSVVPFTAYVEGWGLYAEQLAWEAGYEKNPLDNIGRLQLEMFRAVRLVVDTGMHAKHWTREQAIDYMFSHTGMTEGDVVIEIERYLVMPGQALAYKVGMLKILELRERAKTALGSKFDIREFHDEVLKNGAMPLGMLEQVIDAYIARK